MKKMNFFWSIIVIFTMSFTMVALSQNILLRSSETYSFYFNDSRVVNKGYTTLSAFEMAEGIEKFMWEINPDEFQIYEDTGYDQRGVFSEEEGHNMLAIKKVLDISGIIGIISFFITLGIYIYFLKNGKKKVLRDRYWISLGLSMALVVIQSFITATNSGRSWVAHLIGMVPLDEEAYLNIMLGGPFISMANTFFIGLSMIIIGIFTYICLQLTKPPRIFF